eukprot:763874-Hanusia_phi.AAC.4
MWAVLAAPLLIGAAINNLTAWDLATYSNVDVINVDQDVWGIQGSPVFSTCPPPEHLADLDDYSPESMDKYALTDCVQVWARPLSTGSYAVILLNLAADSRTVACDLACMAKIKALRPEMRGTNGTERQFRFLCAARVLSFCPCLMQDCLQRQEPLVQEGVQEDLPTRV